MTGVPELGGLLHHVAQTPLFVLALGFLAGYPLLTGVMWTASSLLFAARTERRDLPPIAAAELPFVSVLVAAFCEEAVIESTLAALLNLDYPHYEVVVVDDASTDHTVELVRPFLTDPRLRLVEKRVNQGKAMALNDALPLLRGEIVLVIDADIRPRADVLRHLVPHFAAGRVGAVAGNPQVDNTRTLLGKVQVTEFASIVSVLRRAQRTWGRILTVSGAICAFRRSAVVDVGLFDPDMATEDIALTWKLQRRCYDVRYEPQAVAAMQVPETLRGLWSQRLRWATGLAQVLRRHAGLLLHWRARRMWPVLAEAVLSILWAHTAVVLVAFFLLSYALGQEPLGADPLPSFWGMTIATLALLQLGTGIWLERRYHRGMERAFLWAPIYPLFYWILMTIITVRATLPALLRRRSATSHWRTHRVPAPSAGATPVVTPAPAPPRPLPAGPAAAARQPHLVGLPPLPRGRADLVGRTEVKGSAAPARLGSINQVCGDTAGGWLWSCDQHDNHGNASSQAEADHVADAHVAFHNSDTDGPCEVAVWHRTTHRIGPVAKRRSGTG